MFFGMTNSLATFQTMMNDIFWNLIVEGIVVVYLDDILIFTKMVSYSSERGKRDVDCDKQVKKAVTAPNCMLKGLWGEGGSGGIRKKLKSEYAAYLESKYRRNDRSSI